MSDWTGLILRSAACALLAGAALGVPAAPAPDPAGSPPPVPTPSPANSEPNLAKLSPDAFLRLLVARNLEIQFSQINTDVTRHLEQGEAALYEPTFFLGTRQEGRNRQRTPDERLQNTFTAGTAVLDETAHNDEFGIRSKLPTGAEVTVSYKASGKSNNLISKTSAYDTEYTDLLNITLKQPLLRNAGRAVTETDRRIAELEHQIALQQLVQQTLKTSIDGLTLYWQLYRAQETVALRKEAMASSEALMADANSRVSAGRAPASALLEMRGAVLNREAELARSLQALLESRNKLSTAINMFGSETEPMSIGPQLHSSLSPPAAPTPPMDQVLGLWSPYQIALLRQQQAQIRLNFASNQALPVMDLIMSYGGTGFSNKPEEARKTATQGNYPDWYLGLNFEIPMGGNQKAMQQLLAQGSRLTQAELELQAIRNAFTNDLVVRQGDLENAQGVLDLSSKEVQLRQRIFDNERQRVQIGSGSLSNLLQKQADYIEAKQRMLENQIRYEVALAMLQYVQGSLLSDSGIHISEALPDR